MKGKPRGRRAEPPVRPILFDTLEPRELPASNTVHSLFVDVDMATGRGAIPLTVAKGDWTTARDGRVVVGAQVSSIEFGRFAPESTAVVGAKGAVQSLAKRKDLSIVAARPGNLTLAFAAARGSLTRGAVDVFLVGDANGDLKVDANDVARIRSLQKVRVGSPRYDPAVDADRNGRIDAADLSLARRNLGASTILRPVTFTLYSEPSDRRFMTARPADGTTVDYYADKAEDGTILRYTGFATTRPDGRTHTVEVDDRFRPKTLSDDLGNVVEIAWLSDTRAKVTLRDVGADDPIEFEVDVPSIRSGASAHSVDDGGAHARGARAAASAKPPLRSRAAVAEFGVVGRGRRVGARADTYHRQEFFVTATDLCGHRVTDASLNLNYKRFNASDPFDATRPGGERGVVAMKHLGSGIYYGVLPSPYTLDVVLMKQLCSDAELKSAYSAACQFVEAGGFPATQAVCVEAAVAAGKTPQSAAGALAVCEAGFGALLASCKILSKGKGLDLFCAQIDGLDAKLAARATRVQITGHAWGARGVTAEPITLPVVTSDTTHRVDVTVNRSCAYFGSYEYSFDVKYYQWHPDRNGGRPYGPPMIVRVTTRQNWVWHVDRSAPPGSEKIGYVDVSGSYTTEVVDMYGAGPSGPPETRTIKLRRDVLRGFRVVAEGFPHGGGQVVFTGLVKQDKIQGAFTLENLSPPGHVVADLNHPATFLPSS